MPNKPIVPTAHTSPITNPPRPMRRHIGRPFGSRTARRHPHRVVNESGSQRRDGGLQIAVRRQTSKVPNGSTTSQRGVSRIGDS